MEEGIKQNVTAVRPLQVKIEDFKKELQKVVAGSDLPPFLLEMIIGEYLSGISRVAEREYIQARAEWEKGGGQNG